MTLKRSFDRMNDIGTTVWKQEVAVLRPTVDLAYTDTRPNADVVTTIV